MTFWEPVSEVTADHSGDNQICCQLRRRPGADFFTVAHDRHFVGDFKDFFHFVRYINNGYASFLQIPDNPE
ncbi:hypothetical protein D3C74_407320 [compost metagenome]